MEDFDALWRTVTQLKAVEGIMPLDVLELPDPLGGVLRRLIRAGRISMVDFAADLNLTVDQTRQIGDELVARGYLVADDQAPEGEKMYRAYIARMRRRSLPVDL